MNVIFEMNGVTFLAPQMHNVKITKALIHVLVTLDSLVREHMTIHVMMKTNVLSELTTAWDHFHIDVWQKSLSVDRVALF